MFLALFFHTFRELFWLSFGAHFGRKSDQFLTCFSISFFISFVNQNSLFLGLFFELCLSQKSRRDRVRCNVLKLAKTSKNTVGSLRNEGLQVKESMK